tara:strand:+ start:358 stop:1374 length:1017 start_codon:yes stop_codon:yes gene_type:complete
MSGLQFTYTNSLYKTTGPADQGILLKNRGKNAIVNAQMGMPQKFYPSAGDSMFSNARQAYVQDSGGGTILSGHFDASQQIALKKLNAIGKSSTGRFKVPVSFQGQAQKQDSYRNSALARVRGGGCVAPKKKGAIANTFKGTCGCTPPYNPNFNSTSNYDDNYSVNRSVSYYTGSEVVQHNTRNDAWVVYEGKVYDITDYEDQTHFDEAYLGTDITYSVNHRHDSNNMTSMEQILENYYIGNFIPYVSPTTTYTVDDVSAHNLSDNAWISYQNKVYNVTTNPWKDNYASGTDITDARAALMVASQQPGFPGGYVPNAEAFGYLLQFYQIGVLGPTQFNF